MTLRPLLDASPAIQLHAFAAIAAFLLGAVVLFRRKGDRPHRFAGRLWVALMLAVALSSFFIHTIRMWGPWSPIHLLSLATLAALAYAVRNIRRGNVAAHAAAMKAIYAGALVVAGIFTLAPGRIMNRVVFGEAEAAALAPPPAAGHGVTVLGVLQHTPIWVWAVLLYVLYVGWSRTRDRVVAPWRLLVMPAVIAGLAVWNLAASGLTPAGIAGFTCGAVAGGFAGMAVARRRPAQLRPDGMLAVRGDWLPLLLVVGIFAVRYAQGVALGIDPALAAHDGFALAGVFASGLFAAMMAARTLGMLPPEFYRSLPGARRGVRT
jgi:uncharacterized membrane protein